MVMFKTYVYKFVVKAFLQVHHNCGFIQFPEIK